MAMYNNFPQNYNPYGQSWRSPMDPMNSYGSPQQPQRQNNGITWVQGEAAAKSYLVAPNETAQLWDSESQTIYLKSADASGMPSMRVLDYTFRDMPNSSNNYSTANNRVIDGQAKEIEYATKSDLDNIATQMNSLAMAVNNLTMQMQQPQQNQQQNQPYKNNKKNREDDNNAR